MSSHGSHSLQRSAAEEPGDVRHGAGRPAARTPAPAARRWTLHGLNNGTIFRATRRGVAVLPASLCYAIGHAGTWIAWRLMASTRAAIADNLRPLFPGASEHELERHSLQTLRSYARDVIDFIRALDATEDEARTLFLYQVEDRERMQALLARNRGAILVTGHYGNWELGSVAMRKVFQLPLTIVAMPEEDAEVNRIRRAIREALDTDTIDVRKALDTALQIRKRLSENRIVAMLIDRHMGRDRVEVSLLGRRAWFLRSPALMAYLTEAPLVPCFIERVGGGRFSVHMGEPIPVTRDLSREDTIRRAAQGFADQLSVRIRMHPHQWYHFYPYWQSQDEALVPPGAAGTERAP